MLSPSRTYARCFRCTRACSTVKAIVLLPDPLSPVNQIVAPFCLRRASRSSRPTCPSCQVMFVALIFVIVASAPNACDPQLSRTEPHEPTLDRERGTDYTDSITDARARETGVTLIIA